jgi:hypothetical protein
MVLYDMSNGQLNEVAATRFADEGVLEREHLQAAIRENVAILGDDLLVVAEEFGEFADANRRIDLLCVDRSARLVVVELKRTNDGGHMELQSLRYAAMVSTMTADDLEKTFQKHLAAHGGEPDEAASRLAEWFDEVEDSDEAVIQRDVRIILASAGFDKQITTTVLWLNDVYGLDIRCVRLTPYRIEGRLLLDVQHVIPLPEAAELTVQLRRREQAVKATKSSKDYTRFVITTPDETTPALSKRRAINTLVVALHRAGVSAASIAAVLPRNKVRSVDGTLDGTDLVGAFIARYPSAERNLDRWFLDTPLKDGGQTWVLSKMWGLGSAEVLSTLITLAPTDEFSAEPI